MTDWSQGSAYLLGDATSDRVSDHESDTDTSLVGSRWVDLYRLLLAPATEGYALRAVPDGAPIREASGDPTDLITQAERAGAGQAVWAIVAPVRPDLVVVDLDHCADRVLSPILSSGDDAAAQVAHLAASGSPDSVHVAFACPSNASRDYLIERIHTIRAWEGLSPTELDLRTAHQFLRLPGSASLKPGGGWCYPIDEAGARITATAATMRADRAIRELPTLLRAVPAAVKVESLKKRGAAKPPQPRVSTAILGELPHIADDAVGDDIRDATGGVEQPRAWRPRRPFTAQQWAILHHSPSEGYRSHAATAAAWVLWQYGIRSWRRASAWYRTCPAFVKFAARDDGGRAHWESIKAAATAYRPHDPAGDDLIRTVLTEISSWDDPALVAAAYAVIAHRFDDGYGTDHRPIAWRDMALWLNVSHATAGRRIKALVDRGLLVISKPHDRATAPHAATCYSLSTPPPIYRTDVRHDLTPGGRKLSHPILHRIWGTLGHPTWAIWTHLPTQGPGTTTSELSAKSGLPPGTLSHGVRRTLALLAQSGLAVRTGKGRGTRWLRGPQSLAEASDLCGATAHSTQLARTITGEREAWHAPTVRQSMSIRQKLRRGARVSRRPGAPVRPAHTVRSRRNLTVTRVAGRSALIPREDIEPP